LCPCCSVQLSSQCRSDWCRSKLRLDWWWWIVPLCCLGLFPLLFPRWRRFECSASRLWLSCCWLSLGQCWCCFRRYLFLLIRLSVRLPRQTPRAALELLTIFVSFCYSLCEVLEIGISALIAMGYQMVRFISERGRMLLIERCQTRKAAPELLPWTPCHPEPLLAKDLRKMFTPGHRYGTFHEIFVKKPIECV
jgi:hypothetical protein